MQKKAAATNKMVFLALMSALYVVLNVISPEAAVIRMSFFCFLPVAVTGSLMGPVYAVIVAVLGDVLSCFVKGYAPYIPLTLTALLSGMWYGLVLEKQQLNRGCIRHWLRAAVCIVPAVVVCEIWLNSYALSVLRHQPMSVVVLQRLWGNIIEIPVKTALLMLVLPAVQKLPKSYLKF